MLVTNSETRVERLLDLAEDALDRGDVQAALELCIQVLVDSPEHPGATYLQAEAFRDLGDTDRAEDLYRTVIRITPDHAASWSGLAWVLFDQVRMDEARIAAIRAVRADPDNPEALYVRAMLRERRGDTSGALRDYTRAYRSDPVHFPMPGTLTDAMVESIVEEALRVLHPSIRAYLSQVSFILEEFPEEEVCLSYEPTASPADILGYFTGVSLSERSLDNPWTQLPSAIVLFRRNLERLSWKNDRLVQELRITIFHEVGHFLGLDEEDMEQRGLD